MKSSQKIFFATIFLTFLLSLTKALKEGECEVCVKTIDKFVETLNDETKKDPKKIDDQFRKFCKISKGKENRFVSIKF